MHKPDDDGVIRLRSKPEILAAHNDCSLLMVGGYDRGSEILGEFMYKPGFAPEKVVESEQSEQPIRLRKRRF